MSPRRAKAAWAIEEKTSRYKAKVGVWPDGTAEYTLSRPAPRGLGDFLLGRKAPWVTEHREFNTRDAASGDLPSEISRLVRRMRLPRELCTW